ncbi:Methyl farnesoate epoxidase [Folsomia candida]|uniref:Methyl farnesoate epoxidase n=1 Tax=Folsomia candida TaxID=158441 RepID=A0A226D0T5_FOLCA|nr:Methyl farnesoate epoxidase [Folsomia candida]
MYDLEVTQRHSMQSVIEAEICDLVTEFRTEIKSSNGTLTIRTTFILSVLNVLWCMIAGVRYAHDDPKLVKMLEKNFGMTKAQTFIDPVHSFPFLKKVFPKFLKTDYVSKVFEESHQYSQSLINERKMEGAYLQEPQNYIDCFLKKIEESKNDAKSVYTTENLQMMIEDFMQTGSTTSVGTLNYGVLFLTLNPKVQQRCQAEIDAVVPRHLVPTLDDIEKMPYFQATILETHRLGNIVPIPIPRVAPTNWTLRGYTIPKDTIIISNHYSVHMDEEYWGDPKTFRPDRFINDKGEFVQDKHVCQFGFGKRYCIGVTLTNSVIPIYIATLLQNFNFSVLPGTSPPTTDPELGVSLSPQEFSVHVTARP